MKFFTNLETKTPLGTICILEKSGEISGLYFSKESIPEGYVEKTTPLLKEATNQLMEYFDGKRKEFDLPLRFDGTEFQVLDWKALCTIPYGETRYYQEIAEQIGRPKASRAVGLANNKNKISIFIPCHRVIGKDGSLVGYGGGMDAKVYLLELEKNISKT